MKILITGAGGFIGSFLVEYALSQGFDTYAGIRSTSSKEYLQDERIKFIDLAYSNKEALKAQLMQLKTTSGSFDYIVHNAGVTKCNNKADFERINYGFTKNFVEALVETGTTPKKFIYMSSLSAWGPGNPDTLQPIQLSDTPRPNTLYGSSKLQAEHFIESVPQFPYLFVRPTGVYGPREKDYFVFNKTMAGGIEPSMGFKTQYLTFIYVRDLVRFVFTALTSPIVNKGYFITDGKVYTGTEYAAIVKKHLGRKHTLKVRIPLSLVKCISSVLDTTCGWFGKSPTLNRDKYKLMSVMNWMCETTPLQTDFSFTALYDLDKGMEESIEWYRKERWL